MHLSLILVFSLTYLGVLSGAQIQRTVDPSESELSSLDDPPDTNCTCTPFYDCYDEESSSNILNIVNDRSVITVSEDAEDGECPDILDICCYNLGLTSATSESANTTPQPESPNLLEESNQDFNTSTSIQPLLPSLPDVSPHTPDPNQPIQSPNLPKIPNQTPTLTPLPGPQTEKPSEIALTFPSIATSVHTETQNPSEISPTQVSTTNTIVQTQTTDSPGDSNEVDGLDIASFGSCGIRNLNGVNFTINGFKDGQSQYGEFPWMVAVLTYSNVTGAPNLFVGGGSLIDPSVVLTAAHKAFDTNATLKVRVGEWNFAGTSEPIQHQDITVNEIIIHPRYGREHGRYNLALLVLDRPAILGKTVATICLPSNPRQIFDGQQCVVSGWGKDIFGEKGRHQRILKSVNVNMVGYLQCQLALRTTKLGSSFKLHQSFVCAGDQGKDACTDDGGSPLICPDPESTGKYVQVGITAWGIGCGQQGIPGVYAAVATATPWIQQQLVGIRAEEIIDINDRNIISRGSERCSTPDVRYSEKCDVCNGCLKCHKFNVGTCKCHRIFRCRNN